MDAEEANLDENLANIARHADATRAWVKSKAFDGRLLLEVRDNGRGITQRQISDPQSFGVIGMRERLYPWGGEVKINGKPGSGTTVRVTVRLGKKEKEDDKDPHRR